MRTLTVPCLSVHEPMESFRLPVCLQDFEQNSERPQALDKLSVFREMVRRLELSNGRQSGLSVATCQSGPTCPAAKRVRGEGRGERKLALRRAVSVSLLFI